jgi:hypothetical protein
MECYQRTGQQFTAWLAEKGLPGDTEAIDTPHIRAFLTAKTGRASAAWPRTARGRSANADDHPGTQFHYRGRAKTHGKS